MYLGPLRYIRSVNDSFPYLHGKAKNMKVFTSPFFYLPVAVLLSVHSGLQDLGLWQRIAMGGIFGLATLGIHRKSFSTKITLIDLMILGLVAWPLLKYGAVSAQSELHGHIARMALLFGITVISADAFRNREKDTLLAFSVGAQIALIIAGLTILPAINDAYKEGNIYLASGQLFAHKNYAAATLLMLLPAALSCRLPDTIGLWLQRMAVSLAVLEILLLQTRGVWVAAFLVILISIGVYSFHKKSQYRNNSLIALGIITVGIGLVVLFSGSKKIIDNSTIQSRMHYWKASKEMFLDNPISGVGAGQWKVAYPGTGLKGTNESVMNGTTSVLRPHNDLIWLLSETGVGALFFIALIGLCIVHLFQHKHQLIFGLTTIAFVGYGLGEFPLERATLLIPFGVALGYLSATSKVLLSTTKLSGLILTSAFLIYSVFISYSRINGEKDASLALDGYQSRNTRKMIEYSASAQSPYFEMDIYNNPMPYFEGLGILMQAGQKPNSSALKKCAAKFQEALEIHPNHMLSLNQMGQIRRLEGKLTEAQYYYDQVLSMSPRNTSAALRLIEIRRLQGDIYGSLDALKMIDPKYNTPQSLPNLGREAVQTLQGFASIPNPRAASKELHRKLQGQKPGAMWQTWVEFRKNNAKK